MIRLDPRTPVLVGAGTVTQRGDDVPGRDAIELMVEAMGAALDDAGGSGLGSQVGLVAVPRGTWECPDAGWHVARALGATSAATLVGEIGVLQQTLITTACEAIASGDADVVVVCGAEDRHRARLARRAGAAPEAHSCDAPAARDVLRPRGDILAMVEIERDLAVPAHQYAVIESALAHAARRTPREHRDHLGALWESFGAVAATNPDAWDGSAPPAEVIARPSTGNRPIAYPYTRLLCSQWTVDQGAALVLASAGAAESAGVDRDRWVFPRVAAESNSMVPMVARAALHRWPAFACVADAVLAGADLRVDDVESLDLYSCFPAAVQVQAAELGVTDRSPLTVTGGMTFAGGPLNSYVLHATATMARTLRETGGRGLVTSVSGMLTKPAAALWSAEPPTSGFVARDVTAAATAATRTLPVDPAATGQATIAGGTVLYEGLEPRRAVAICDTDGGARTVAVSDAADVVLELTERDPVGRTVRLVEPGVFR